MKRIKKDDEVIITAGKNKGAIGKVEKVDGDKVIVSGQNLVTKHVKPNPSIGEEGGRIKKEAPIHISNLQLVEDGKPVRVGFRLEADKKVRYSKKSNNVI